MKKAVIDMGSNSVRLILAECSPTRILSSEKHLEMTRLAQGVDSTGLLQPGPMEATLEVIRRYRQMAEAAGAELPTAYATSAVRDAKNGEAFAAEILIETGVPVRIVPGALEAELGFMGVAATLENPEEPILVVDIGGGSTECIVGTSAGLTFAESHNVGAVRMMGRYVTADPIPPNERKAMEEGIREILNPVCQALKRHEFSRIYGIGGTLTTAAAMNQRLKVYDAAAVQHYRLGRSELKTLVEQAFSLTVEERKKLPGLQPKRADVIPAGFLIMECLLDCLDASDFYTSDADNLEGILFKYHLGGGH